MKVALVNTQAPFVRGGAEYLVDSLATKLEELGHQVAVVNVPFKWYPLESIPRHMLASRLLRLDIINPDLVISHKFPAYYVPYPEKKLWLFHQFRQVYELWGTPYQDLPNTPQGRRVREMVINADNTYLREARQIFTNSQIVANRLKIYNQITATGVLFPPLLNPELFSKGELGNYFFYPSRLTDGKRQFLAIEAMRHVRSNFQLVLAGNPDSPTYGEKLKKMIARYRLQDRVKMLGWISDEEKARYMANAYAVLYLPYDEDSYGFVTLEAFHSHKPVIVFKDSGGTNEVMQHGFNGYILDPTPEILAEGMEQLWAQRQQTVEMGENAYRTINLHHISWDYVLERLLS